MSATEAYLAALDGGDDRALLEAEEKLKREQGGGALVRCLESWLEHKRGGGADVAVVERRLADLLEDVAKSRTADDAAAAAARAAVLRAGLSDEGGADRAAALALALAVADQSALDELVEGLGGRATVSTRVSRRLKDKELKADPAATAALRRVLARLAELDGDKERAFLEMLRAVRKAPQEPLYVDEVFRLCLAAEKHQELTVVLCELAEAGDLSARHRATLWNKVGHLRERELDDEAGALSAYRRSLALFPESKGAQRHVERLSRKLAPADAIEPAEPKPEPEPEPKPEPEPEQEIDDAYVLESREEPAPSGSTGPPPPPPDADDNDDSEIVEVERHEPISADAPEGSTHSARAAGLTLGTQDPTQQDMSSPPVDEVPTKEAAPPPSARTVLEDPEAASERPSLYSTPPPLPDDDDDDDVDVDDDGDNDGHNATWAAGDDRHSPVGDEEEEAGTEKSRPGAEDVSTALEVPRAAATTLAEADLSDSAPSAEPSLPSVSSGSPLTLSPTSSSPAIVDGATSKGGPKKRSKKEKRKKGKKKEKRDRKEAASTRSDEAHPSVAGPTDTASAPGVSDAPASLYVEPPGDEAEPDELVVAPSSEGASIALAAASPATTTPAGLELPPATFAEESASAAHADRTEQGAGARNIFADADSLLEGDDALSCVDVARELLEHPNKGSLVARLAARALLLTPPGGEPIEEAIDLFVEEAPSNAALAVSLAEALWDRFDDEVRQRALPVWVAAARAAGDDVARARAFLEPFAAGDAPHGMAFRQLDQSLAAQRDIAGRDALWARAFAAVAGDDERRRRAILVGHIRLLSDAERHADTLPLYEKLVIEVAPADEVLRERALAAFERHGDDERRDRFLERVAASVEGPQAIALLRRLLQQRRAAADVAAAERAARLLLTRNPGDPEAVDALCELLASHGQRGEERAELLRLRFDLARRRRDPRALPRAARELAEQLTSLARRADGLDVMRTALLEMPDDEGMFADVSERLSGDGRDADLVKLIEDLVDRTREPRRKVALLLKGVEVSRVRLKKLSRAQELVERALEISPDNVSALLARADIAQDLGDAGGALAPLERLAAKLEDPAERARVHYRIGRLLEEHLLRPDDAQRRYRAAVEGSPGRRDAWEALLGLAEKSRNRDDQVEALHGIARLADAEERAALYKRIALLERDERVDVQAAERALLLALEASPSDQEAFDALLHLVVARITGEHDLDAALSAPWPEVLVALEDVLEGVVSGSRKHRLSLPPRVRRLYALSLGRQGELEQARTELDALLKEAPTDLATLTAYAGMLEERARSDPDASARRKKLLETALLHHAPDLDDEQQVRLWGDVGALRWFADERESARKALRQAVGFAVEKEQQLALSDGALEAAVSALKSDHGKDRDARVLVVALRLLAARWGGPEGLELLLDAARVAGEELQDPRLTREVLLEAIALDPDARAPKKALLDLDVQEGNSASALKTTLELLDKERDDKRRAALQAQLAELYKSEGKLDAASEALKRALKLDPQSRAIVDAAEAFFDEKKDAEGLASLYAAQLKSMSKDDVNGRVTLLERLAQVRRYDLRDLAGAVEALEAITALDPEATKPREDAARLYTELGQWREAAAAWRGVLERDPLAVEGWRSLFSLYARTKQVDEAFSVAASMVAVEIADEETARTVRAVRPPFPRWPRAPKDPARLKRRLGHPLEATPLRMVLDMVGLQAHRLFARPLKEFGVSKRERLAERQVPPSVMLAIRTAREIVGLHDVPPLYRVSAAAPAEKTPPFALLPAPAPGLVISDDALAGGMTPERAFALGRAMAWLMPHAILAGTLPPPQLKEVLDALVVRFISGAEVEGDVRRLEHLGHQIEAEVFRGLPGPRAESLRRGLLAALRDYVHARDQVHLADWMAGVNYTADRLGFLLAGDLTPSVRVIKASAASGQQLGARLAIKELVLFSVSAPYLTLRRELGLALPDGAARPVLELV